MIEITSQIKPVLMAQIDQQIIRFVGPIIWNSVKNQIQHPVESKILIDIGSNLWNDIEEEE